MDFQSTKEIFLKYPMVDLLSICLLISKSQTWTYTDEYGGIRVYESDNWIDFINQEDEVFQVKYMGEGNDSCLLYFKQGEELDISKEIENLIIDFFNTGKIENIENKLKLLGIEDHFKKNVNSWLSEFDKNGNGEIDLIANDFFKLLTKHQNRVIEIDKNFIHQFVKISNFIKTKKQNTQKIFESIRNTSSQEELEERVVLLKNQIHSYELLVFHSINMIGSLASEDLITFYEIYETFDKLGMFNSNWENEVSEKLTNIGDKLDDLMYSIYNMEQNIVSELSHLSYMNQESFEDLNRSVTSQLKEVKSSINTNNLLTGIQAYQLYKINKNTRGLRS
jgi:hypothetical protein